MHSRAGITNKVKERLKLNNHYCCLGVLCNIVDPEKWDKVHDTRYWNGSCDTIPQEERENLNLTALMQSHLTDLNDGNQALEIEPHTFDQIADWIEENIEVTE